MPFHALAHTPLTWNGEHRTFEFKDGSYGADELRFDQAPILPPSHHASLLSGSPPGSPHQCHVWGSAGVLRGGGGAGGGGLAARCERAPPGGSPAGASVIGSLSISISAVGTAPCAMVCRSQRHAGHGIVCLARRREQRTATSILPCQALLADLMDRHLPVWRLRSDVAVLMWMSPPCASYSWARASTPGAALTTRRPERLDRDCSYRPVRGPQGKRARLADALVAEEPSSAALPELRGFLWFVGNTA